MERGSGSGMLQLSRFQSLRASKFERVERRACWTDVPRPDDAAHAHTRAREICQEDDNSA